MKKKLIQKKPSMTVEIDKTTAGLTKAVSERALFARINRKLRREADQILRRNNWRYNCGRYFITDYENNVVATQLDLEQTGRDLGVLAPHEALATD